MGRSLEGPYTFLPGDLIGVGLQSPWLARKPVRAGSGESGLRKVFLAEDKVREACDVPVRRLRAFEHLANGVSAQTRVA